MKDLLINGKAGEKRRQYVHGQMPILASQTENCCTLRAPESITWIQNCPCSLHHLCM